MIRITGLRHEPRGSELERAFAGLGSGKMLMPTRADVYDVVNAMSYSPLRYEPRRIAATDRRLAPPGVAEVRESFLALVRTTRDVNTTERRPPPSQASVENVHVSDDFLDEYLAWAERELVLYGPLEGILTDPKLEKVEKVHKIISNPRLGNSDNRGNVDQPLLARRLNDLTSRRLPVQLVVPAFPFKDQGAFNTDRAADQPDFSEVALLVRMHCLALALSQVHVEYAHWVILSDGPLYAPLFGLEVGVADRYLRRIRAYRDRLNLQATISVLSLRDVIRKTRFEYARSRVSSDAFLEYCADIRQVLEVLIRSDDDASRALHLLSLDLMWNIDTRRYLDLSDRRRLWAALCGFNRSSLFDEIYSRARETAFRYAACNIALGLTRVVEKQFPQALRATSHAKVGQIALPRLGHVAPWNGVAVRSVESRDWAGLECVRIHKAWRQRIRRAVCLPETGAPFYYETR